MNVSAQHSSGLKIPFDHTRLDRLMPHPIYASLAWVCVVSPSAETFEQLKLLIAEAHRIAADRYARRHEA